MYMYIYIYFFFNPIWALALGLVLGVRGHPAPSGAIWPDLMRNMKAQVC